MSLWDVLSRHGRRSRFLFSRPRLEVLENRTLLSFIAAPFYDADLGSRSVAVGDFNGDGSPDLAVAGYGNSSDHPGTVTILLEKGNGTFQVAQSYATGSYTFSMAVGDLNSDGKLDLAVTNDYSEAGTVSVLLGQGDGSFQAPQSYAAGSYPISLAVADVNSDGIPDLAVANVADDLGTVSVLLGQGDGTFQAPQSYGVATNPSFVVVGDFNRDGKLDLAVTGVDPSSGQGMLDILPGNGDSTFQAAQGYATGRSPTSVAVADFNGDGSPDLAVANGTDPGTVTILLGNGDGTLRPPQSYAASPSALSVAVADFNGDGRPDLAVTGRPGVVILLGQGDGSFQAAHTYHAISDSEPGLVAVGDFDSDGKLDLAIAGGTGVTILLGQGDSTFQAARTYAVGPYAYSVAVGDFNADGLADLAVGNFGTSPDYLGMVSIFLGQGDGTFQAARTFLAGFGPNSIAVGDFNGDGKQDLATTNFFVTGNPPRVPLRVVESDIRVFLGNGDGTFQAAQTYIVSLGPSSVVVRDFNGDGIPDLAVANAGQVGGIFSLPPDSTVSVLLGNGDGTFQAAHNYAVGLRPVSIAMGDFNGDGIPDLVVANAGGDGSLGGFPVGTTVSVLLGNGDSTFQAAQSYAAGTAPVAVAVGDFNGDGKLDLAVANNLDANSTVSILLGNGDGTFQAAQGYAVGAGPSSVVVEDFNRDGIPDVAVANLAGTVSVLLGNGDGTFQLAQDYLAGPVPTSLAVGDFNGDGYPDLVVANDANSATVSILLNRADWGGGQASPPPGAPSLPPTAHRQPPIEAVLAIVARSQAAIPEGIILSRPLFTARHAQDAVFERWGDEVLNVLAMHVA
jgi:hypothetical protein